jgi:hypothetical protein
MDKRRKVQDPPHISCISSAVMFVIFHFYPRAELKSQAQILSMLIFIFMMYRKMKFHISVPNIHYLSDSYRNPNRIMVKIFHTTSLIFVHYHFSKNLGYLDNIFAFFSHPASCCCFSVQCAMSTYYYTSVQHTKLFGAIIARTSRFRATSKL